MGLRIHRVHVVREWTVEGRKSSPCAKAHLRRPYIVQRLANLTTADYLLYMTLADVYIYRLEEIMYNHCSLKEKVSIEILRKLIMKFPRLRYAII